MKRVKYLRLILITAVINLLIALLFTAPVFAVTLDQPDSTPYLSNIFANRNLITGGDMLVYGYGCLPYSSPPDTPSNEAFSIRLMDPTGTTEYASNTLYVYFDNGYNYFCFSLYLSDNSTWGCDCLLRFSENPAFFASPTYWDFTISPSNYSTYTSQEDNQSELASKIVNIASDLQVQYPLYTFLQSTTTGFVLASPTGETYFIGAIPNLQYMAPSLFLLQSYSEDITSDNWSLAQFDIYAARFNGLWVGTSFNTTATEFNITPMMVTSLVIILPLCVGAVIVSSRKYQKAESGFIFCSLVLLLGAVMGWIPAAIYACINQLLGIYIAYVVFYSRG